MKTYDLAWLKKAVAAGENKFIEFKHKVNFPEKIAREVVAFANTSGGDILVGVDDNRTIFGLKNADEEIFAIENVLRNYVKFPVTFSIKKINVHPKKDVVVLAVEEAARKPNFAFEKPGQRLGTAYVRIEDKSVKASPEMIQILRARRAEKGHLLNFGEVEKAVLQQVAKSGAATVRDIENVCMLSYATASATLVRLVLAGVLKISPEEGKEDHFSEMEVC